MKIGFYTAGLGISGGNKRVLRFAQELVKLSHSVTVIVPHSFRERETVIYPCRVANEKDVMNEEFDFILGMNPVYCSFKYFSKFKVKKRGIYILHLNDKGKYSPAYQKWINYFKGSENFYVFGNNPDWKKYYDVEGIKNTYDLIGGIDIKPRKNKLRKRKKNVFSIVCNASSLEWKGFEIVKNALNRWRIKDVFLDVIAFAVGKAEIYDSRWPIKLYYNFPYEKMPEIYMQGDVFVYCEDKQAGWGNTAIEAMICGVPVICTKWGTTAYAKHLENAYIVENDATDLRNAIEKLYLDIKLRKKLIIPYRDRVKLFNEFSYNRLVLKFLKHVEY